MEKKVEIIAELSGLPAYLVPRSRQREELASDHYHGGYVSEAGGLLHPAKYAAGLRRVAHQAGARLVSGVRVTGIAPSGSGFSVSVGGRRIRAAAVLVATNGYSHERSRGGAFPWLARRMVPITSYIVATEEIGENRVRDLFPTMRAVSDTRNLLNYFRPSPDGKRILWGGRARLTETTVEFTAPILHRFMTDVIPSLGQVKLTHAWKGNVGFTFDFIPHLGRHDGIHYAAGCQGSGVAMMSWLGHNAALEVAGRPSGAFALAQLPFPSRPGYTGHPWFLPIVGEWYRLRDKLERGAT
jgi:glycine/D-amino acid oxidase-like deaminating enzyme